MAEEPRAKTVDEVRDKFMRHVAMVAKYWSAQKGSPLSRCNGLAFSLLVLFDGGAGMMPAFDIVAQPQPDDKEYQKAQGENWIEPGLVINDCQLHEAWNKYEHKE